MANLLRYKRCHLSPGTAYSRSSQGQADSCLSAISSQSHGLVLQVEEPDTSH